jgi:cytochrome P450
MAELEITDIEGVSHALRHPDLAQALYDAGAVIMDGALVALHGEEHRKRRVLEFRVFRRDVFRWYETEVFPRLMDEAMGPVLEAGKADLIQLGYQVTMNLTATFSGIDRPRRTVEETDELLALVKTFSEGATMVHSTRDPEEVNREVRAALLAFEDAFLAPSKARRNALIADVHAGRIAETELPRDVLTELLRNVDRLDLPHEVLRREIAFYLQAGSHSTANATVHAIHEILGWIAARPEDGERIRHDPVFLQRCVHESLRLHPASPVAWRKPMCALSLRDGRAAAPGDRVVVNLAEANQQADVFGADAANFNPYRAIPTGHQPFGLTFGIGVHACLGRDLDGGLVPREGQDPASHQYGVIALFVQRILAAGARPDPDDPPMPATYTARPNWGRYPVRFDRSLTWQ